LVALASAWSLTWYQSLKFWVWVWLLQFICKIIVTPRCQCIGLHMTSDHVQGLLCLPLSLYTCWLVILVTREWGCWSIQVDCTSPFHQFRLLVALASA
jgi:hypothetical protein